MASSSSSSSGRGYTYDVFLNFRGVDTRKIFVGHLHKALTQKLLNSFIDAENLRKGDRLLDLPKTIADSKISIVVFSQNYASSTWCLKELVQIMKCKKEQEQIVVPVFYQVDPSHVRKQEGSFAQAFAKHESNDLLQEVQRWRFTLIEATNLSGWDSRTYEDDAKLVDDIVDHVFKEWSRISSSKNNHLVGMDSHLRAMRQLLRLKTDDDVLRVGIWGMGGIGKTTIATEVYDEIRSQFDHYFFLRNVKEGFSRDQVCMQEQLLSGILKKDVRIDTLNEGYKMMRRLSGKRVLVVLDDVDNSNQIKILLGPEPSFGGGSRIIVTTRDSHILSGFERYEVKLLTDRDAHKLFCQHAFKINKPSEEYDHLSRRAVKYAQGLPLPLAVLGSFLYNRSVSEWEYELEKLKKTPNLDIQKVLKTSFDGLDRSMKDIFLDIACFYRGVDKDYVTKVLDSCGFCPHIGLKVLVERALLTISDSNKLEMHDLLQEMGREIESTKEPGKQSRFWSSEDVDGALTGNMATKAVEGLMNDLPNSKEICIEAETFVRMTELRLLIFTYQNIDVYPSNGKYHVNGDLRCLSHELRVLIWHKCPLKSLPSNFHPKNLVELDMCNSDLERLWQGIKPLKKLISINLSGCPYLNETPDLTEAMNLEKLDLGYCSSLSEIHESIAGLTNLVFLSLKGCSELKSLPSSFHLKSLKTLHLSGCSNLEILPEIWEDMNALSELTLEDTAIKELPSSIEQLRGLKSLSIGSCKSLVRLSDSICNLEALSELNLDETAVEELPSSIERLQRLKSLSMKNCTSLVRLPDCFGNLAELKFLNLEGCSKLQNLPDNFGSLESLLELEVNESGLEQLPVSILHLKLGRLFFNACKQMVAPLSSWPSSIEDCCTVVVHFDLSDCNLLDLSDAIAHFSSLKKLTLSRNNNLESLPTSMNRLDCLEQLELEGCKRLKSIPELSSSISYINARDCTSLERVSTPKRPYDMGRCFAFSNCSLLVQTDLFRNIVETHCPPQGNYSRPFYTSFPGSEIPGWFRRQCRGSSVTARLPPNWFDNKFLGFVICAVTNKPQAVDYYELSARCLCIFKGNYCKYHFSFNLFDSYFNSGNLLESNHMLLGYVPWSEFGINEEEVNERCYTEAKFEIQLLHCEQHHMLPSTATFDPSIERCDPCIEKCGVQFFFSNNEEVALQDFVEPMVHSEGCSAEPSGSDMTGDNSHEEQYLKLLSKLFDGPKRNSEDIYAYINDESDCGIEDHEVQVYNSERSLEGCAAEPSGSAITTDTSDKDEQYLKFSELVDKPNRNFTDIHGDISDESDCEIEDNDSLGKRKIVSWWRQKVRVTSGLKQGLLDDGFSWKGNSCCCIPEKGTQYLRCIYNCTHQSSCQAIGKLRTCINNPTICKIKYIGRHTCWKTLPMLTHQVRVTPDMGIEVEGPSDGFSWGEYGQMNLPGAKHPRVCYVCTPQNVRGCMAIKEVQRSNDDPTILKITYRGRHTCIQAYTISIGGRGDGRISEGDGALRIHDQVVQSPRSLGDNGSGGNVSRLADRAMDDNNVNMLPDANSQDMEHSQDVNHMANKNMAGYPNHGGCVSEGTSDAVVNQKRVSLWKRTLRTLRSLCTSIASRKKK